MEEYLMSYPPLLNVEEVAQILGVTKKTVRNIIKTGALSSVRIGRLIRIPKDKLIEYLQESTI